MKLNALGVLTFSLHPVTRRNVTWLQLWEDISEKSSSNLTNIDFFPGNITRNHFVLVLNFENISMCWGVIVHWNVCKDSSKLRKMTSPTPN